MTIICKFDRIGRSHDLTLEIPGDDPDDVEVGNTVYRYICSRLASNHPGWFMWEDGESTDGCRFGGIVIEGGRSGSGTWTVQS